MARPGTCGQTRRRDRAVGHHPGTILAVDAVVLLACANLTDLDATVNRMRHLGGVEHTVTYLVLPAEPWTSRQ